VKKERDLSEHVRQSRALKASLQLHVLLLSSLEILQHHVVPISQFNVSLPLNVAILLELLVGSGLGGVHSFQGCILSLHDLQVSLAGVRVNDRSLTEGTLVVASLLSQIANAAASFLKPVGSLWSLHTSGGTDGRKWRDMLRIFFGSCESSREINGIEDLVATLDKHCKYIF